MKIIYEDCSNYNTAKLNQMLEKYNSQGYKLVSTAMVKNNYNTEVLRLFFQKQIDKTDVFGSGNVSWHIFAEEQPKKYGDYLCKVRKINYCIDCYQYEVVNWAGRWITFEQGWIVVAWTDFPRCEIEQ